MCPLYPFHLIFMYASVLLPVWLVCSSTGVGSETIFKPSTWNLASFYPSRISKLVQGSTEQVFWSLPEHIADSGKTADDPLDPVTFHVESSDRQIADVTSNSVVYLNHSTGGKFNFSFSVTGKFLGHTVIRVSVAGRNGSSSRTNLQPGLPVSVVREDTVLDKIFLYSVIGLVSLAYINMGCSLDLRVVWDVIRRPVGPSVGITCQYLCMPVLAFCLARLVLPSPSLQLGLFVTGCSPGGGASNIWTVLFNGNLNLSITLTFISTVLALGLMPVWIFSAGRVIFDEAELRIPYKNIIYLIVGLLVPVSIGVLIRRKCPLLADWLMKLTRPFSLLLIVYIFTFGIYANVYVFYLITWEVVLSAVCLIWFGFAFGYIVSRCLNFAMEDIIAIAIETGIQNTGVAILLLKLSLPQPDADMTFVVPIVAATAMPIPLTIILVWMKLRQWLSGSSSKSSMTGAEENGLIGTDGRYIENGGKSVTVESFVKASPSNGSYVAVNCKEENAGDGKRDFLPN